MGLQFSNILCLPESQNDGSKSLLLYIFSNYLRLLFLYSLCYFFLRQNKIWLLSILSLFASWKQIFIAELCFLNTTSSSSSLAPSDLCHFFLNLKKSQAFPTSFSHLHFWFHYVSIEIALRNQVNHMSDGKVWKRHYWCRQNMLI